MVVEKEWVNDGRGGGRLDRDGGGGCIESKHINTGSANS